METKEFTKEQLIDWALHAQPEQLKSVIEQLSSDKIMTIIESLYLLQDPQWRHKTRAIIAGLVSPALLEAAGNSIIPAQALDLLDHHFILEEKDHWKLSPLLVGMPHEIFKQMLIQSTQNQLSVLKHEAITEPMQRHLSLLSNESAMQIQEWMQNILDLEHETNELRIDQLGHSELSAHYQKIENLAAAHQGMINTLEPALAIAWNSERSDIIEKLSLNKEHCQRSQTTYLGHPRGRFNGPSGLYAKLEERLYSVYDPGTTNILRLQDDDSALEALGQLSVWYLEDYLNLGLLPGMSNIHQLDLDPHSHTEQERLEHRKLLFQKAKKTLNNLGISTVRDLKEASIFSKRSLKEFLQGKT